MIDLNTQVHPVIGLIIILILTLVWALIYMSTNFEIEIPKPLVRELLSFGADFVVGFWMAWLLIEVADAIRSSIDASVALNRDSLKWHSWASGLIFASAGWLKRQFHEL